MSNVTIKIDVGSTQEASSAYATGILRHVITDEERATFGIQDRDLMRKVGEYMRKQPDGVWVKSPTPPGDAYKVTRQPDGALVWTPTARGDAYKLNNWDQVETVLIPTETKILSIKTEPTIVSKKNFDNSNSSKKAKYDAKLSEQLSTTVGTTWSRNYNLPFNQNVSYDLKFLGTGVGGNSSLGFQKQWGKNSTESRATTIGTEAGVSVELEPGEKVVAELSANLGTMKVRITYDAILTGIIATSYSSSKYGGYSLVGVHIQEVLGASKSVKITEDIEIKFYSEVCVSVKDLAGKTLRRERSVASLN